MLLDYLRYISDTAKCYIKIKASVILLVRAVTLSQPHRHIRCCSHCSYRVFVSPILRFLMLFFRWALGRNKVWLVMRNDNLFSTKRDCFSYSSFCSLFSLLSFFLYFVLNWPSWLLQGKLSWLPISLSWGRWLHLLLCRSLMKHLILMRFPCSRACFSLIVSRYSFFFLAIRPAN